MEIDKHLIDFKELKKTVLVNSLNNKEKLDIKYPKWKKNKHFCTQSYLFQYF